MIGMQLHAFNLPSCSFNRRICILQLTDQFFSFLSFTMARFSPTHSSLVFMLVYSFHNK